jgi:hypothetical protein
MDSNCRSGYHNRVVRPYYAAPNHTLSSKTPSTHHSRPFVKGAHRLAGDAIGNLTH